MSQANQVHNLGVHFSMTVMSERAWSWDFNWLGWNRIISFGFAFNVTAPAVSLWLCACHVRFGRLPKTVNVKDSIFIPQKRGAT